MKVPITKEDIEAFYRVMDYLAFFTELQIALKLRKKLMKHWYWRLYFYFTVSYLLK